MFKLNATQIAEMIDSITSRIARPDGSLPNLWCDLSDEQKNYASDAVKEIYLRPSQSARQLHDLWMKPLIQEGWSKGDYSFENKRHPCLTTFDELPDREILKDEIWSSMTQLFRPYYTSNDEEASNIF